VQVCPTGIDIRNGLQYECIGCAACVDVCDGVMDKMGYPRGLVRYATQNGLAQHFDRAQMIRRVLRPRVLVYTGILILICLIFAWSIAVRDPFRVDVVRDRSSLARVVEDGKIENIYRLQVMNSAEQVQRYRFTVDGLPALAITDRAEVTLGAAEAQWVTLHVQMPHEASRSTGTGCAPDPLRDRAPGQPGPRRGPPAREVDLRRATLKRPARPGRPHPRRRGPRGFPGCAAPIGPQSGKPDPPQRGPP
jgi:polyferredoxin